MSIAEDELIHVGSNGHYTKPSEPKLVNCYTYTAHGYGYCSYGCNYKKEMACIEYEYGNYKSRFTVCLSCFNGKGASRLLNDFARTK